MNGVIEWLAIILGGILIGVALNKLMIFLARKR